MVVAEGVVDVLVPPREVADSEVVEVVAVVVVVDQSMKDLLQRLLVSDILSNHLNYDTQFLMGNIVCVYRGGSIYAQCGK